MHALSFPALSFCDTVQEEGKEADKVLVFFPHDTRPNDQAAAVGLVQAMLAFSSIFSPVRSTAYVCKPHALWWSVQLCEMAIYQ